MYGRTCYERNPTRFSILNHPNIENDANMVFRKGFGQAIALSSPITQFKSFPQVPSSSNLSCYNLRELVELGGISSSNIIYNICSVFVTHRGTL